MSAAANNWLKDRPLLTVLFSFLGSLILAFTVRAVNNSDEAAKSMKIEIDKKASIEYVDKQFINHESKEQVMLNRLENIITLSLEKQEAVVNSIDKRLERIENNN